MIFLSFAGVKQNNYEDTIARIKNLYVTYINHLDKNNMKYPGIVIEFKVFNFRKEDTLKDTLSAALKQINEKDYDTELTGRGVKKENIRPYGFAFKGKEVLIGTD